MDLLFPLPARISTITPSIISNTALSRSIFSGASRTLARSGDRFGFDVKVSAANDAQSFPLRAALRNLRAALRGQANRVWLADPSYSPRGSFPTGELMVNGNFAQGSAGWVTNGANLTVADCYGRVQNTASTGYAQNANVIAIISGAAYVARALVYPGNVSLWGVWGGVNSGGATSYFNTGLVAQGLNITAFESTGTTFVISLVNGSTTVGDFVHFLYASLSRCALVNGASQTGPNLSIGWLPISASGLLLPGDRVQIGTQLNTVVAPLDSDGAGAGYLQCALPWRVSPPNNSPVIISNPMARCIQPSNTGSWDESPGKFADFEFTLEESLDA